MIYGYSTKKLTVPKIRLDSINQAPCFTHLEPDSKGHCFTLTTIKKKAQEMTLSEIEEKLGHKVKIISE